MKAAPMFRAFPLLIALALPFAAQAAEQRRPAAPELPMAAAGLTLADAEARLVERNLSVVAARRGVDIARAQRLVADTAPAASLGYGQTLGQVNEDRRLSGFYGSRVVSPLNNMSLSLSYTVERGGKRELRTRLADEQISVAEAQVLDALRGQIFNLRLAFIQGLKARANLQVALANRNALNGTEGLLSRQVKQGAIPESDLLRFQASRLPFEQDVASAAQAYVAAVAQIAALVGADATAPRAAPRGNDPIAVLLAGAAYDLRGSLADTAPIGITREALAEALPRRPDVLAATRGVNAADANTRLAEAGRYRDVTLGGSLSRTELSQDLPNSARQLRANDALGVSVSIPLFTSKITQGNVAVAVAQRSQAQAQAGATLATAQADLATAWASYEQARALLGLTTGTVLNRAEEAYRSTETAYMAGGRSLLDTLDALRTLNATRVSANAARADYATALATLEQASGASGLAPKLAP